MRRKLAALVGTVLLAGGTLASATSASAASAQPNADSWDHIWTTSDSAHGGTIYIHEHGDTVRLCDTAADGATPRALVFWSSGHYVLTAGGGVNHCIEVNATVPGADLPENTDIYVDIWRGPNQVDETNHVYFNDL
ncbi:hypothetical protein [Streptomyces sp. NPDC021224]|uniref:hypothetical protein n=1 Tax=unclassified Streptomyces TaxID=2593676 RepID=UPI00378CE9B1